MQITVRSMSKKGPDSQLAAAAAALDAELHRYAELASEALQVPLTSEKGIDRSARALLDAAECEKRVMTCVQALVAAVGAARQMQEQTSSSLSARAEVIAKRRAELDVLLARFTKLGEAAKGLNDTVAKVAGYKGNPYAEGGAAEVGEALERLETGMAACAQHAEDLAKDAASQELPDLVRQADGLRQQILSAKNKLSLVTKRFTN
jgi:hypothetical protein